MPEKKAFVFDTNFIIQVQKLDSVIENLKDSYTVYVSQVSIDERIAQQCRELKEKYKKVEEAKELYKQFATIGIKISYDDYATSLSSKIQTRYSKIFGEFIIPFSKDSDTFSAIINRANQKLPPFSTNDKASDKGFKDCLLWLSLLYFFRDHGEPEVVFSTDDHGFLDNKDFLFDEFHRVTGKEIDIKPNSAYREIIKQPTKEKTLLVPISCSRQIDVKKLREEINNIIDPLCTVVEENYFGDERWIKTFSNYFKFAKDEMKSVFENMERVLNEHLFERSLSASVVFNAINGIVDGDAEIPMNNIESAVLLYRRIKSEYPQYLEQFFEAAARILNNNFVACKAVTEEELPF